MTTEEWLQSVVDTATRQVDPAVVKNDLASATQWEALAAAARMLLTLRTRQVPTPQNQPPA